MLLRRLELSQARLLLLCTLLGGAGAVYATYASRADGFTKLEQTIFFRLFAYDDHVAAMAWLAAIVLTLLMPPLRRAGVRLVDAATAKPLTVVALAFVAFAIGTHLVYSTHALAMDEYTPRMQAHALARGRLAAQYPIDLLDRIAVSDFRGHFLMTDPATGRVASAYWPGLALLMAPFAAVGMEWLVNPLLGALTLWLLFLVARDMAGDERAGGWAMLLALASPQFTVNALSFYAMPGLLALDLLFAWLLMRETRRAAFAAGLIGGLALVLHNPVPHALFAAPWLLWLALDRQRWPRLAAALLGYVPLGLVLALGWPWTLKALGLDQAVANSPQAAFLTTWLQRLDKLFQWPSFELVVARVYATWKTWIWACPGLLVAAALALRQRDNAPWRALFLASFTITYLFYWFIPFDQGHGWGYRYIHSAWAFLPLAAAGWAVRQSREGGADAQAWRDRCSALLVAGLLMTPVFLWQTRATIDEMRAACIEPPAQGRWAVFITFQPRLYTADLIQNLPGDERVLRLLSYGSAEDERLIRRRFPTAKLWLRDQRGSAWNLDGAPSGGPAVAAH